MVAGSMRMFSVPHEFPTEFAKFQTLGSRHSFATISSNAGKKEKNVKVTGSATFSGHRLILFINFAEVDE
jgi:hypothetical protein